MPIFRLLLSAYIVITSHSITLLHILYPTEVHDENVFDLRAELQPLEFESKWTPQSHDSLYISYMRRNRRQHSYYYSLHNH